MEEAHKKEQEKYKAQFTYDGKPFTGLPDLKIEVGAVVEGETPELNKTKKEIEEEYELDTTEVKKFMKVEGRKKKTWTFSPQTGDEGEYKLTLIVILRKEGKLFDRLEYSCNITVFNDLLIKAVDNKTEIINPFIKKVDRKGELSL